MTCLQYSDNNNNNNNNNNKNKNNGFLLDSNLTVEILQLNDTHTVFLFIYLFIYCHLYSAFSIVQCSNALYRL